ncbi:polysaccharide biosynthesis/export family protein [Swaminathania salitolerans]|uniref:polysaccharide biosynthesis/export family protein n=1 Tax=Swaminathania salitolerans TaxID=182838 RepID=UPI0016499A16|nr:polysaccharide biosynthesis/export family protein [Swaminathania salitolerans]
MSCLNLSVLCACSALPDSGPTERQFQKGQKDAQARGFDFAILPLHLPMVDRINDTVAAQTALPPIVASRRENDLIGPGDVLQVTVYEIGNALFSGASANASGSTSIGMMAGGMSGSAGSAASTLMSGNAMDSKLSSSGGAATPTSLPPVTVDSSGSIYLPFIGKVHVAGRNREQVGALIKSLLARKSQFPDVVVHVVQDNSNFAVIYGDVKMTGKFPLTSHHERILDAVATAQGTMHPPNDEIVTLTRAGTNYTFPMRDIDGDNRRNIVLQPDDTLKLVYNPLTFTVFGAANKVSEIPFEQPTLTLAQALSRAAGLADYRADPNAVYLMRYENNEVLRRLGVKTSPVRMTTPVVYKIDMMDPASYFVAQRFEMKNKDLIYVANSRSNKFYKFFGLISTIIQPGITAGYMAK